MAVLKEPKDVDSQNEASDDDENRYGEEPDFSDPEDFVDDISDEKLMPDLLSQRPKESDGMDSVVVVDGIPMTATSRLDKLKAVIRQHCNKVVSNEHYPLNEKGECKGYCFLEFQSHKDAVEVVKNTNKVRLDKNHTLTLNLFSDFEKYEGIPDKWEPPVVQPFKDQGSRKSYLLDPDAFDQYVIVYKGGDEVAVHLNSLPDAQELQSRSKWTDTYVRWSPLGSYLATFHAQGIALWGGETFAKVGKFEHHGVQFIDFSPCETYIVTFAPVSGGGGRHSDHANANAITVWDMRTLTKKRSFHAETPHVWPVFKWSFNDKFFGRMKKDGTLSVYETPSFGLLEKKSIKMAGMRDFSWSPSDNILAYWVAEDKDVPARVVLLELPSRNEVRVKNLFNVANCKMHWQKSGDYLCVKVDRYSKIRPVNNEVKYMGLYCNFEVFHMREKQIPVDSVEIKEDVHAFAWEPVGSKFGIIHAAGEAQSLNVSFYVVKTGQTPTLLKKYERKTANHLFWSPAGQFVVLAGLRQMNGEIEFIDTSDFTTMNNGEHFMCTDIEWDPTGRYVMTAVSWWGHKVDNAYWLWSFQGKILKRYQSDRFCQLLWRPRPPTLLGADKLREIKKNLKKYSVEFDNVDRIRGSKKSKELLTKRKNTYDEYMAYRKKKEQEYAENKEKMLQLRGGIDTDNLSADSHDMEEEVVEFLVKEEKIEVD